MTSTTTGRAPSAPVTLVEGDELPVYETAPITRTDIVRYAGAGGDLNPIHHDEPFAQSAGMPSTFAMGMLQGGILAQRLARWVGPENVTNLSIRFTGQVWPGDVLTLSGRVTGVSERVATIELAVARQTGDRVIAATATTRTA